MTIHKSETKKYRIKKTSHANGHIYYTTQKTKRYSILNTWDFMCNHPTEEDAMKNILREIEKDNRDYNERKIKEEYL